MAQFVVMKPECDNVATAVVELAAGAVVRVGEADVMLRQPIRFGHKFAIRLIRQGEPVVKYGQVIGTAVADIAPGDHAHTHNIESNRGRGDKVHADA